MICKNLYVYMTSYPVKENHIGSAVNEIFWYKKTDNRQTGILLLYYKDLQMAFVPV